MTDGHAPAPLPPIRATRFRRGLLAVVVLFLGGSGLVYEYSLSTLATHLVGNSIEQFSLIIALMLFAMGLAGLAQRRFPGGARLAEGFVLVEILLGLVGGASAVLLYLAYAYLEHFHFALYGLALAIGFCIGLEIPFLMRINEIWREDLRDNVGDVLSLDYIGALVGALIWAFILLPLFSLDRISLILGLLNLAVAAATLVTFWSDIQRRVLVVSVLLASIAGLGALGLWGPQLILDARQHLYADPIQHHSASAYQDLVVTGRGGRMALYLNGHLQFDSEDEYIYHELLVHPPMMALARPPERVLVLGGGDGLAVREILRWPSVREVVLVDLDPAVTRLARTYAPLVKLNGDALNSDRVKVAEAAGVTPGASRPVIKRAERDREAIEGLTETVAEVTVMNMDADAFIHAVPYDFDVLIIDFPDPSGPDVAKLYSLEFYLQARKRLRPGGVLAVQAGSPYATRRAFWSVHDTLEAAGFKVHSLHAHVPNFGEWGWHVARADGDPRPEGDPPILTRWLDAAVLDAAGVFARPIARPIGPPQVSTRLDPKIMSLYLAGEPVQQLALFPGRSHR